MSDQHTDTQGPPYEAAAALLASDNAPIDLAEAHGLLTGMLCARHDTGIAAWTDALFDGQPASHSMALLEALHELTRQQLASEELSYAPFLPGDDAPLAQRAATTASWCQGFLSGLGLAGIGQAQLDGDADEFLRDVMQISRLAHDELDDGDEESEADFMELAEYLRVGVYLIRETLQPAPEPANDGDQT